MEFGFTETQQMFRSQLREYVEENVVGEAVDWDDEDDFPHDVYGDLADMGVVGMSLPEEAGGDDLGAVTTGVVYEEIGRGDVGLAALLNVQNLVNELLYEYGTERQQEIAKANARGENFLAFGLTEPGQGSDAQSIETRAERDGDEWVISGEKTAITVATLADYTLLYAREAESGEIRTFVVPMDHEDVEVQPYLGLGCVVSGWGQIFFDDARLSEDALLSDRNGFKLAMESFDKGRGWVSLYCAGAAAQTLEETKQYMLDREVFDQQLARYQGPQFEHAEMKTRLEMARLMAYKSLWESDEGQNNSETAAMAKWYAPDVCSQIVRQCIVLHGHYGYAADRGLGKRMMDVIGHQIADGTPQIQKNIIARETFGREYLQH